MKRIFYTIVILTALFIAGNAAHAYFLRIDGADPNHYLVIDGSGSNILMICSGRTARGLHRMGTGLQLN